MRFFLTLTRQCNMKCIYCSQGNNDCRSRFNEHDESNPDVKKVAKYFPETGEHEINLFGGEPFLKFDYMIELAYAIKERNPNIKLDTVTNGTMLTVERANKLNALDIMTNISHDGPYQKKHRGIDDFLEIDPYPYLTLNKKSFVSVATGEDYDFNQYWDYFDLFDYKHHSRIKSTIEMIRIKDYTPESLAIYNNKGFEDMLDSSFLKLEKAILAGKKETTRDWWQYDFLIKQTLRRLMGEEEVGAVCGADKKVCHTDLHGNLYTCHNTKLPSGNLLDEGIKTGGCNPHIFLPKCQKCPALLVCGGGCVNVSDRKHKYSCYTNYHRGIRILRLINNIRGKVL